MRDQIAQPPGSQGSRDVWVTQTLKVCANRGLLYSGLAMPKMKTHSGAKKRFKLTATGKVRGRHSFTSHILEKKSPKRKRHLGRPAVISKDDTPRVKILLGAKHK
jgi:large subunit ribosomal protein L35